MAPVTLNVVWLWISAAVALGSWVVHTFVGGPQIVPQLLASGLTDMPKYVLYFVWHIATILLLALAAGYALAAAYSPLWPLAVAATVVNAAIAALILTVAITRRVPFRDMPQWTLFLLVAALGAAAIWL
jgi:hypothetical protein